MTDLWTVGETMVSLRASGPLGVGTTWSTHVAGAESNVAIGVSRLGHTATWRSRLGDDSFGALVRRELLAEGVLVEADTDAARPTGFMLLRPSSYTAEVTYFRAGSAASALGVDVAESLVAAAPRVVLVSGITPALGAGPAAAVVAAVRAAREVGALVVLDVNHRSRLWSGEEASAFFTGVVDGVDVVIGSPEELELIAPSPAEVLELGPSQVVSKLGADGARLLSTDGVTEGPTLPLTAVDPVGAGDAFTAGYISGLLDGVAPVERLARANALGAAAVRHRGDYEGLPRRDELEAWLSNRGGDVVR